MAGVADVFTLSVGRVAEQQIPPGRIAG